MAKKIMIVDDEPHVLQLLGELLQARGYDISMFKEGSECLDVLKSGVAPDLLILDIRMPKLSGVEMVRRIREELKLKKLKIVFLTASQYNDPKIKKKYNVEDYIYKPFDISDLTAKLTKLLE